MLATAFWKHLNHEHANFSQSADGRLGRRLEAARAQKNDMSKSKATNRKSVPPNARTELVVPRLLAKWREHAKEAARDLDGAIDLATRTRLATEARILERCARQLEQGLARQNEKGQP